MVAIISSHPVAYFFFEPLGTPSPVPWDFSLYAGSMIKGVGDVVRTSPMPLDHCGARVASQQSPTLHNGAYSLTMTCISGKSQRATISAAYDETLRRDFGSPGTFVDDGSTHRHKIAVAYLSLVTGRSFWACTVAADRWCSHWYRVPMSGTDGRKISAKKACVRVLSGGQIHGRCPA